MAYWHIITELLTSSNLRYRRPFCRIYKISTKKLLRDIGYASQVVCMSNDFDFCRRVWDYIKYPWDDTEATTITRNLYHTLRYAWDDEKRDTCHESLLCQARITHHFK